PGVWIEATARDAGRDCLPITLVAMGLDGRAIGAATLGATDGRAEQTCAAGAPWLVDMVVRDGERRCGIGRVVVSAAGDLARGEGRAGGAGPGTPGGGAGGGGGGLLPAPGLDRRRGGRRPPPGGLGARAAKGVGPTLTRSVSLPVWRASASRQRLSQRGSTR